MRRVEIQEAKQTLSRLLKAVERGESIVLIREGSPVAKLVALGKRRGIRVGMLRGRFPKKLLDDIARPLSRRQVDSLFGLVPRV